MQCFRIFLVTDTCRVRMLAVRTFAARLPTAQASVAARFTAITVSSFVASVSETSHPQRREALLVELLAELDGIALLQGDSSFLPPPK